MHNDRQEMDKILERFLLTCFSSDMMIARDGVELALLDQLTGEHLEKASQAVFAGLEKEPDDRVVSAALKINPEKALPLIRRWYEKTKAVAVSEPRAWLSTGYLAFVLSRYLPEDAYIDDVIQMVRQEGYSDFTSGVGWLASMPLTRAGIAAVWDRYKKGRRIKEPGHWRESCAFFLREKINEPIGQNFLDSLPADEQSELLELIGESYHQRLERKFRLERYIYGRERYSRDEVNWFHEYVKVGGSPVPGMTLKHLLKGHTAEIDGFSWSPTGRFLASFSGDDTVRIWEPDLNEAAQVIQHKKDFPYSRVRPQGAAWIGKNEAEIAILTRNSQTASRDEYSITQWDHPSRTMIQKLYGTTDPAAVSDFLFFPDRRAFLWCTRNEIVFFDPAKKSREKILDEFTGRFETVSLSPDGKILAVIYYETIDPLPGREFQPGPFGDGVSHKVLLVALDRGTIVDRFDTGHLKWISKMCWMPGRPLLAIASGDNTISIWDLQERKQLTLLESEGTVGTITALSFSADGGLLASKSHGDHLLRIWRTDRWEEVVALKAGSAISFHPSLPVLASACLLKQENDFSQGDAPSGICLWEFEPAVFLRNPPFMKAFHTREAEIRLRLRNGEITEDLELIQIGASPLRGLRLRQILKGHTDRIQQIQWSPSGQFLASTGDDHTLRVWEQETGKEVALQEENEALKRCSWSPDSQELVYGGETQVKKWNVNTGKTTLLIQQDLRNMESLSYSPDGKMLALAYHANTIQVLDTSTWKPVSSKVLHPLPEARLRLEWSDDSRRIYDGSHLGRIRVFEPRTLELIGEQIIPGDYAGTHLVILAVHGDTAAVAAEKQPIRLIDLVTGQLKMECADSGLYVSGLSFSPDGIILCAWCHDHSVQFWRTDTGQKIGKFHEYTLRLIEPVFLAFHPHQPLLVTYCDKRRSMRVWEIDPEVFLNAV